MSLLWTQTMAKSDDVWIFVLLLLVVGGFIFMSNKTTTSEGWIDVINDTIVTNNTGTGGGDLQGDAYWTANFYSNKDLTGTPVLVTQTSNVLLSDSPSTFSTQWSARWTKKMLFSLEYFYHFMYSSDDGFRLYIDNVLTVDSWKNQALFWNGPYLYSTNLNGLHTIVVEYYQDSGNSALVFDLIPFKKTTSTAPNILKNSDFTTSGANWGWHSLTPPYVTWVAEGKQDTGALHFTPNTGATDGSSCTEAWQCGWNVSPGDKIIYEGWFKLEPTTLNYKEYFGWQSFQMVGIDLRARNQTLADSMKSDTNPTGVLYNVGGISTYNTEWTYFYMEFVVPCIAYGRTPLTTSYVSDGFIATYNNAGAFWYNWRGQPFPELKGCVWIGLPCQMPLSGIDIAGRYDNLKLSIVRNVQTCS